MDDLDVRPLTVDTWEALAALFAAGGDPKGCWCQFWRMTGSNWTHTTPDDKRDALRALVGRDPAPGLVAMRDGKAVGWVGLGPRENFGRLARSRTIPQLPGDGVWVVNCFVVAKTARRSGVARALLDAAVAYARAHGASVLEGYPAETGGERMSSASAYTGTTSMFERAGFEVASPTTSKAAA
ncbi:MAG: GNAT family N-acetyltransferase, partial [Candidatus Limnocylindrales bacterium]